MTLLNAFGRSFVPSLIGLFIGCYAASVALIFLDAIGDRHVFERLTRIPGDALTYSTYALIFATPAMLMINWPFHAYLLRDGHATYWVATYIPAVFILLAIVFISVKFAVVVAIYALAIAWTAHWFQVRLNRSFKPDTPREPA